MDGKAPIVCQSCGLSARYLRSKEACPVCEKLVKVGPLQPGKKAYFRIKDARAAKRLRDGTPIPTGVIPRGATRSPGLESFEWDPAA